MRRQPTRLSLALLVAGLAGICAAPGASAAGTVCDMLTPAQLSALHAPKACTPKTLTAADNQTSFGFWQPTTPGGARLAITVVSWKSAKQLAVATKTIRSLPGTVQTIKGIGTVAYESSLGSQIAINFVKGHTVVNMQLQSAKPLRSAAPFNAAAKAVAARV
jgi:hypothetical protein